jgi:hypothetical protein
MDGESKQHRRAASRVPLQAMVTYRLDGQEYGNLAADVSPDGIFIRTFMPPAVGTRLELTVRMPARSGGLLVELEGRVRRRVDGQDPRQNGMGIQFTAVHATDSNAVRFLVSQIFGCQLPPAEEESPELDPDTEAIDDGDTRPE